MSAHPSLSGNLLPPAGLLVPPALWAANMEWGQLAPYLDCRTGLHLNVAVSLAAAILSALSGWLSWRSVAQTGPGAVEGSAYPASRGFVGRLAALSALLFAYALLLQAVSGLLLTGCER